MLGRTVTMTLRRSTRITKQAPVLSPPELESSRVLTKKRKATSQIESDTESIKLRTEKTQDVEVSPFKKPANPITPAKARQKPFKAPPLTPTPSLINVLKAPYSTGDVDDDVPPPRFVDPHATNAALVTPNGTQVTTWPSDQELSPTKMSSNHTTTATLLSKAEAHLIKVDARFEALIAKHRCAIFSPEGLAEPIDPFRSLVSGICGQQVSGAAAKSIKNKFVALYNEGNDGVHVWPKPKEVADTSIERLRTAGLSQRKAEYIQGLAAKFADGSLSAEKLLRASDEEVIADLIAVRGLGMWSVEMFACFGLKRTDIFSTGDLGVQRGMAAWFGKDVSKLKAKGGGKWKYMSEQDMLEKSAPYAPYRSLFMWYMWRAEDVDTAVLES